jgi:hypothetical protein
VQSSGHFALGIFLFSGEAENEKSAPRCFTIAAHLPFYSVSWFAYDVTPELYWAELTITLSGIK